MKIIKNVLLKHHTSFKIGGPAKHFVEIKNREDLISAIKWARKNSLLFFVLGGGSNVLVSDNGFNGLVIKVKSQKLKVKSSIQKSKVLEAEAGVKLKDLVNLSAKEGLTGLEWAAGIPGTIGGAIYGNAAAFGKSMADVVESVEILEVRASREVEPPKIKILNNKQCQFSEKNSVFKQNKNLIILSAVLKLKKRDREKIKNKIKENLSYRDGRHPKEPSAGCIFVNEKLKMKNEKFLIPKELQGAKRLVSKLKMKNFPEFEKFKNQNFIPASFLVEKAGLKGKKIGGAMVSEKHGNFIVNAGGAKAEDVLKLANFIKRKVKEKFGVELVLEIQKI